MEQKKKRTKKAHTGLENVAYPDVPPESLARMVLSDVPETVPSSTYSKPDFSALNWIPVSKNVTRASRQSFEIVLPFRGVAVEDVPDVLQCFGGLEKVAASLRNPRENFRKLVFDISPSPGLRMFSRPNPLTRNSITNTFVLDLIAENTPESEKAYKERSKKELSAVERALGTELPPLQPTILDAALSHVVTTSFEFTELYDFRMCPSAPVDKTSFQPDSVELVSLLPHVFPTFPMPEEPDEEFELFFPASKFTNQTGFASADFIPSMYTDPLAAQDKVVLRARKCFALARDWPKAGTVTTFPTEAAPGALRNLLDKIPKGILKTARNLFEEQPIWKRYEFYKRLYQLCPDLKKEHRRFVLPGLAYRFSNGPWSRSWCRLGYNPGLDPENRRYQILDFRISQNIIANRRTVSKKHPPSEWKEALIEGLGEKLKGGPTARGYQFMLQLCDLEQVPDIMEVARSPERISDVCDFKEGFFKKGTLAALRLVVTNAIAREDTGLDGCDNMVRSLQEIGLFKRVELPAGGGMDDSDEEENAAAAE